MLDGQLGLGRSRDNRKMFPSLHLSVTLKVPMETNLTITLPKSFNRLIEFMQMLYRGFLHYLEIMKYTRRNIH